MKLKLMADYGCFPTWLYGPDGLHNISPETLDIPDNLILILDEWAEGYEETYDLDDPVNSSCNSDREQEKFVDDGKDLAILLKRYLGGRYSIEYFNDITRELEIL